MKLFVRVEVRVTATWSTAEARNLKRRVHVHGRLSSYPAARWPVAEVTCCSEGVRQWHFGAGGCQARIGEGKLAFQR